mmetsp:Transcript_103358/g.297634  ORF Transcript_103358/g.297634 Transcript_103358/m.297634 type:complete len:202 (-) Transcript_103358:1587-2192(-)
MQKTELRHNPARATQPQRGQNCFAAQGLWCAPARSEASIKPCGAVYRTTAGDPVAETSHRHAPMPRGRSWFYTAPTGRRHCPRAPCDAQVANLWPVATLATNEPWKRSDRQRWKTKSELGAARADELGIKSRNPGSLTAAGRKCPACPCTRPNHKPLATRGAGLRRRPRPTAPSRSRRRTSRPRSRGREQGRGRRGRRRRR